MFGTKRSARAEPEITSSEIVATAIVLYKVTKYLSPNSQSSMSEAYIKAAQDADASRLDKVQAPLGLNQSPMSFTQ
ncbi:hypothetical protein [Brucella pituitosa]|uniref:hypothetical protein n=1 Tax=Brucella pituitosa TaxID=571256 RepID=UPI000FE1A56B|nr:hypothetical protein [Brucella pituitosa]